jgi:hypothetical protein
MKLTVACGPRSVSARSTTRQRAARTETDEAWQDITVNMAMTAPLQSETM